MKKIFGILTVIILSLAIFFTACKEINMFDKDSDSSNEISLKSLEPEVMVKGGGEKDDYEKVVVEELVKKEECKYEVVSGIVQFYYEKELVFTIDFGNGECDGLATVTWLEKDGTTQSKDVDVWKLFEKKYDKEYDEKIIEELVTDENCDEIVSGLIEYYFENQWVATIDFGKGECDGIATKCWLNKDNEKECEDFDVALWKDKE